MRSIQWFSCHIIFPHRARKVFSRLLYKHWLVLDLYSRYRYNNVIGIALIDWIIKYLRMPYSLRVIPKGCYRVAGNLIIPYYKIGVGHPRILLQYVALISKQRSPLWLGCFVSRKIQIRFTPPIVQCTFSVSSRTKVPLYPLKHLNNPDQRNT